MNVCPNSPHTEYYNNKYGKLVGTVIAVVAVSIIFTVLEGVLEFRVSENYACEDFKFFNHGGLIFLFVNSTVFAVAYLLIFMLYMFNLHKRWNLPSKKSFYRYALLLCMVNVVQAVGSMLWYTGEHSKHQGHVGICLTIFTNFIYVVTFAPVVYWIFLSNYFRMNKSSLREPDGQINVNGEQSQLSRRQTSSIPIHIGRRRGYSSYFEEQTKVFGESSYSSSYGSVNDEEAFVRTDYSKK